MFQRNQYDDLPYSYYEAYSEGWAADRTGIVPCVPPWAKSANWDETGVRVAVNLKDLEASVAGLQVYSPSGLPASIEIGMRPDDVFGWGQYFLKLDCEGVPLFVHAYHLELRCSGASIAQGLQGGVVLSGTFTLAANLFKGEPEQLLQVGRQLLITLPPGDAETGNDAGIVKPFRVKCKIVCSEPDFVSVGRYEGSLPAPWDRKGHGKDVQRRRLSSFFRGSPWGKSSNTNTHTQSTDGFNH